jgi:undecaprenyl phosphate N,N'-diacetylbacillosamine 1-phosphate transferase
MNGKVVTLDYFCFKRLVDIAVSGVALVLLSPVIGLLAVLVRRKLGRPVFHYQQRVGRNERIFRMRKFRSMTEERDADGNYLPDEERLTVFGLRLRASSLDELPELLNVLRGDMSLVGPRPLPVRYLPRYSAHQRMRHQVRPGITGLAQVSGRNAISWVNRFDLDITYVDRVSLFLDLKIIALTLRTVIGGKGVSETGKATMTEFFGSQDNDHIGDLDSERIDAEHLG